MPESRRRDRTPPALPPWSRPFRVRATAVAQARMFSHGRYGLLVVPEGFYVWWKDPDGARPHVLNRDGRELDPKGGVPTATIELLPLRGRAETSIAYARLFGFDPIPRTQAEFHLPRGVDPFAAVREEPRLRARAEEIARLYAAPPTLPNGPRRARPPRSADLRAVDVCTACGDPLPARAARDAHGRGVVCGCARLPTPDGDWLPRVRAEFRDVLATVDDLRHGLPAGHPGNNGVTLVLRPGFAFDDERHHAVVFREADARTDLACVAPCTDDCVACQSE